MRLSVDAAAAGAAVPACASDGAVDGAWPNELFELSGERLPRERATRGGESAGPSGGESVGPSGSWSGGCSAQRCNRGALPVLDRDGGGEGGGVENAAQPLSFFGVSGVRSFVTGFGLAPLSSVRSGTELMPEMSVKPEMPDAGEAGSSSLDTATGRVCETNNRLLGS